MRREVRKIENKRKTREEKVLGRGQGGEREREEIYGVLQWHLMYTVAWRPVIFHLSQR